MISLCFVLLTVTCVIYRVQTIDGTARRGEDYVPINEIITFEEGQREKQVGLSYPFSITYLYKLCKHLFSRIIKFVDSLSEGFFFHF